MFEPPYKPIQNIGKIPGIAEDLTADEEFQRQSFTKFNLPTRSLPMGQPLGDDT